jgi:type III secretion system low calcium response chaperone LcrH/SycD
MRKSGKKKPQDKKVSAVTRKLSDEKWLKSELAKGKTAQDILKLSDKEMDEYYNAACLFFEKEKYADAANTYHFLVTMNPSVHEYWLGLAMSTQMCGDYEGALDAYEMAALNEIDSPIPYFYLAKCLFALHDSENALMALDLAIELSADNKEFEDLRRQAIKAKEFLHGRD